MILDPARIAVDLLDSVRRRNAHIPVIVLSARGRGDDAAQCEQWNAARVTKPIRPSELRACIEGALGIRCAGLESLAASVVAPAAAGAPLRILLAEDNPVNQKVAGRMLERSGYQVEIVSDGGLAVGARQSGTFDLILMDVQMPHLDGLEATRVIRNWEAQTGHPRIPIIAMTAHAMAGDRDRCLKPGMACAVIAMIGMRGCPVCASQLRMTRVASRPSK